MLDFNIIKSDKIITHEKMTYVHSLLNTNVFRGPCIIMDDYYTDSPCVFRLDGKWYMLFIAIKKDTNKSGYETHIATSNDLINWKYCNKVLCIDSSRTWDSKQIAGYISLYNPNIGFGCSIQQYNCKYYLSYLSGDKFGYEPDPLSIGIASFTNPINVKSYNRFNLPILTPNDVDARFFEKKTLYKSTIIFDENNLTNHKFIMFYNAKAYDNRERIYMAVSDDMHSWIRYGDTPVIDDCTGNPDVIITGDPMILRDSDGLYIMNIMKYTKSQSAFDTFACSYNLKDWVLWRGEPLIKPDINNKDQDLYAHKPWIVTWENHVYHYYCACTKDGRRYIALATDF